MNKKLIALLLIAAMILSLTACGKKEETKNPEAETPAVPEAETPVPEEDDVVIEQEEVDPDAGVPAEPEEEIDVPAAMPEVAPEMPEVTPEVKPESKPEQAPTANVDLAAFYNEIYAKLYPLDAEGNATGPFVSDMAELQEMVDAFYPGLSALGTKQLHIFMPAMSGVPYELVLVEAANAGDVEAVKAALQSRIDTEMSNHMNYPAVQENWANNSRIVSNGAYVLMAVAADCDAYVEAFNALFV